MKTESQKSNFLNFDKLFRTFIVNFYWACDKYLAHSIQYCWKTNDRGSFIRHALSDIQHHLQLSKDDFIRYGTSRVSAPDPYPDSIGSVDPEPDPDSKSGSAFRRAKMTHKSRNFFKNSYFQVLDGLF